MTGVLQQFSSAAEGLAFEAGLFAAQEAAAGLWTSEKDTLVCPLSFSNRPSFESAAKSSGKRGWPVFSRPTGGGAVPQGSGVLNLALSFNAPPKFTIGDGYRLITRVIREGLGDEGIKLAAGPTPSSFCDGDWNLSIGGKKVVGTAQRWRPVGSGATRVLAHALILTAGPIGPGARAVDAFNRELGLSPVSPGVHTTLAQAIEAFRSVTPRLVQDLHAAARAELLSVHFNNPASAAA